MRKIYYLVLAIVVVSLLVAGVYAGDSAYNTSAPYYKSFKLPTVTPSYATSGTTAHAVKTYAEMFTPRTVTPSYATSGTTAHAVKTWTEMFQIPTIKPSLNPDYNKKK